FRLARGETAHACVGSGLSDDTRSVQNGTQKREAEFRAGTEQYGPGLLARRSRAAKHHQLNMSKPVAVGRTVEPFSRREREPAGEIPSKVEGSQEHWCERRDSNPHGFTRQILSLVRLPIPPLSHGPASTVYTDARLPGSTTVAGPCGETPEGCGKGTHPFCCAECPLSSSSVLRSFMNTRRTYSFHVVRGSVTG